MKKLSERTIQRLGTHITGDSKLTRYRTGPQLVSLFNRFGCSDLYGDGFPSRWKFTEDRLQQLNGTPAILKLIEATFDPQEFTADLSLEAALPLALSDINDYLRRDGYEVSITDKRATLRLVDCAPVRFSYAAEASVGSNEFISENIEKCERKLHEGDYAGAITNARSLCEDVLCHVGTSIDPSPFKYDGDLPKLYRRVRGLLNQDPEVYQERPDVRQVLQGLTTAVEGLASMSNKLGDRHGGRAAQAKKQEAQLAVNFSNTLCTFVLASLSEHRAASSHSRAG